jgi:glycosyltransferase involved in cell wall biosynthesis
MIPNGVDLERFRPRESQRAEFGLPAERLIVLMVSALAESKRVEVGIEAVSKIPGAHLVVAGDGPLRRAVDAQAAKSLPGRFTRLSLSSDKMPSLYQSADVFLHLSKDESFGNVYVEALASGLPIVAHDSPRLRWLLGEDEYLLDTNDVLAIAHSISLARLTTNLQCKERVARAGLYSWPRIAALYREFLHEVIDENLYS